MPKHFYAIVNKETGHPVVAYGQFLIFQYKDALMEHWPKLHPKTKRESKIQKIDPNAVFGLVNYGKFGDTKEKGKVVE